jgi:hypothetical protein
VSLNIGTLNPGESVTMTIVTRVRAGVGGGAVSNLATLSGGLTGQASTTVVIVSALPALGEEPWWRIVLLAGIAGVGVWAVWRYRRRGRTI